MNSEEQKVVLKRLPRNGLALNTNGSGSASKLIVEEAFGSVGSMQALLKHAP